MPDVPQGLDGSELVKLLSGVPAQQALRIRAEQVLLEFLASPTEYAQRRALHQLSHAMTSLRMSRQPQDRVTTSTLPDGSTDPDSYYRYTLPPITVSNDIKTRLLVAEATHGDERLYAAGDLTAVAELAAMLLFGMAERVFPSRHEAIEYPVEG